MFHFAVLFLTIVLMFFSDSVSAQPFGGGQGGQPPWMQGRQGGQGGQPPWMQGRQGGQGGQPPWMQGGQGGQGGQPPWMQGGQGGRQRPGRNGEEGGQQNDGDRNARRIGMLKAMDTNQNGVLEASEVPDYRRAGVERIVTQLGGNPQGNINLNDLERKSQSSAATDPASAGKTPLQGDPLVPPFGEKAETQSPVLSFGQKEPKPVVSTVSAQQNTVSASDQSVRSARAILAKFDKNKNGYLDKDKGEWTSSLPFNAEGADKNKDGRLSLAEVVAATGGTAPATVVATKQSSLYDRLPEGVPPWFFERDKNQDAQLSMLEYAAGKPWSDGLIKEFKFLDLNGDGIATVSEVFAALKSMDDKKKAADAAADKAKREAERRKGTAAAAPEQGTPEKKDTADNKPAAVQEQQRNAPQGNVSGAADNAPPSTAPYASGTDTSSGNKGNSGRRRSGR